MMSAMTLCRVCGVPCSAVDIRVLKRVSDAKLLYERCSSEFADLEGMRCPASAAREGSTGGVGAGGSTVGGDSGASGARQAWPQQQQQQQVPIATAHRACRAAFCARFCFASGAIGPNLHCCWSQEATRSLFADPDSTACATCCNGIYEVLAKLNEFRDRAKVQRAMRQYVTTVVWPGTAQERAHILRTVLHAPPFHVKTPDALNAIVRRSGDAVLAAVDEALLGQGMPPITAAEREEWNRFVRTHGLTSTTPTTSSQEPAPKMRVVQHGGGGDGGGGGGGGGGVLGNFWVR